MCLPTVCIHLCWQQDKQSCKGVIAKRLSSSRSCKTSHASAVIGQIMPLRNLVRQECDLYTSESLNIHHWKCLSHHQSKLVQLPAWDRGLKTKGIALLMSWCFMFSHHSQTAEIVACIWLTVLTQHAKSAKVALRHIVISNSSALLSCFVITPFKAAAHIEAHTRLGVFCLLQYISLCHCMLVRARYSTSNTLVCHASEQQTWRFCMPTWQLEVGSATPTCPAAILLPGTLGSRHAKQPHPPHDNHIHTHSAFMPAAQLPLIQWQRKHKCTRNQLY